MAGVWLRGRRAEAREDRPRRREAREASGAEGEGYSHLGWGADRAQGARGRPAEGCGGWASL